MRLTPDFFFEIEAKELREGSVLPFPAFLFLRANRRYVPFCRVEEAFTEAQASRLKSFRHTSLFVPVSFRKEFAAYRSPPATSRVDDLVGIDATLVIQILADGGLSDRGKGVLVAEAARDLLTQVDRSSLREDDPFLSRINALFDDVLRLAGQKNRFYLEALQLKQLKSVGDFSLFSALMAFLISLCQGITDPKELADIAVAALFRDLGNFLLTKEFLGASRNSWTTEEVADFRNHVPLSGECWAWLGNDVPPGIAELIADHHERFDGTGFPAGKWHSQIQLGAQILHFADLLALKTQGKLDGEPVGVRTALEQLAEESAREGTPKAINPDIIWKVRHHRPAG